MVNEITDKQINGKHGDLQVLGKQDTRSRHIKWAERSHLQEVDSDGARAVRDLGGSAPAKPERAALRSWAHVSQPFEHF